MVVHLLLKYDDEVRFLTRVPLWNTNKVFNWLIVSVEAFLKKTKLKAKELCKQIKWLSRLFIGATPVFWMEENILSWAETTKCR